MRHIEIIYTKQVPKPGYLNRNFRATDELGRKVEIPGDNGMADSENHQRAALEFLRHFGIGGRWIMAQSRKGGYVFALNTGNGVSNVHSST